MDAVEAGFVPGGERNGARLVDYPAESECDPVAGAWRGGLGCWFAGRLETTVGGGVETTVGGRLETTFGGRVETTVGGRVETTVRKLALDLTVEERCFDHAEAVNAPAGRDHLGDQILLNRGGGLIGVGVIVEHYLELLRVFAG